VKRSTRPTFTPAPRAGMTRELALGMVSMERDASAAKP
jgi:hypothetical protein